LLEDFDLSADFGELATALIVETLDGAE